MERCHHVAIARYSNEERQGAVGLILDAGWTAKATAEHLGMNARSVATWANAERAAVPVPRRHGASGRVSAGQHDLARR